MLRCFEPEGYGLYGRRKEAVANAHEDIVNDVFYAVDMALELAEFQGLISDDVHLANIITSTLPELPDSPSLKEALAGPERNKWHDAILEELAAIRDAKTWTLVDYTPSIRNLIGCWFVLQKKCGASGKVTVMNRAQPPHMDVPHFCAQTFSRP